jgi:hypothetical protein
VEGGVADRSQGPEGARVAQGPRIQTKDRKKRHACPRRRRGTRWDRDEIVLTWQETQSAI